MDQEIALHLELRTEKLIAQGLSPEAARAEALRQFGNLGAVRDSCVSLDQGKERAMRRGRSVEELKQDLIYAGRTLRPTTGEAPTTAINTSIRCMRTQE